MMGKKRGKEIDALINFLRNIANLTYAPEEYKDSLERALLLIKNEDSNYVLTSQRDKLPELKSAVRYAIEEGVGFKVHLTDDKNYKGRIGVSPILKKLYGLDKEKIGVGPLNFDATEENLESLSLRMYKEDAAMIFGPNRVKKAGEVIEPAKINLLVITPPKEEKKEVKVTPSEIEGNLKPYMEEKTKTSEKK
jgi:hypothetical protein